VLIDALGFDEGVTKRIQCDFQREGLVELTAVPRMTTVDRPVMDHAAMADPSANNQHDTPGDAAHGGPLRDTCGHGTPHTLGVSTGVRARSWSTRDGGLVPIFLDTSAPGHLCLPPVTRPGAPAGHE
jgi:hypothetical protein